LSDDQQKAAKSVLKEKCRIYGNGCARRGKQEEAQTYLALYHRLAAKDF
jgi:hypothetical protein